LYAGRGRNARIGPGTDRRGIRGARFLVRADAAGALREAVSALKAARFTPDPTARQTTLSASAGDWIAQAMTIGRPSTRWTPSHVDYEYFPLNLLPIFWPRVALTLAIACARTTEAGTELVICAHPSMLRAGARTDDTGALMTQAATTLNRRFTAAGVLMQHAPLAAVEDETCPASSAFVRQRLGWT